MCFAVQGYYTSNREIYNITLNEPLQQEAHRAMALAASTLQSHAQALEWIRDQQSASTSSSFFVHYSLEHILFWHHMNLLIRPSYTYNSFGGVNGCSCPISGGGGGGNGDGCIVIILIIAIIALIASIFVSLGFTIRESLEAESQRHTLVEIEKLSNQSQEAATKNVYENLRSIHLEAYTGKILEATFTAIITAGLCLLTVSAGLALYSVVNKVAFSHLVQIIAISGGAVVGSGILAHCIKPIVDCCREQIIFQKYQSLFLSLNDLHPFLTSPYQILKSVPQQKAYLTLNRMIYKKDGDLYESEELSAAKACRLVKEGYTPYHIPEKNT